MLTLGVRMGALLLVAGCAARASAPPTVPSRVEDPAPQVRVDLEELGRRTDAVASRAGDLENAVARVGARVEALERRVDQLMALLAHGRASSSPSAAGGGASVSPLPRGPGSNPPEGGAQPPDVALAPRTPATVTAENLYQAGVAKFKEGNLDAAVLILYDLVTTYPRHPLREGAQFLVGEIFFSQKELRSALREFEELLVAVPNGSRTPEALLKIGLCQRGLGDEASARRTWQRLISEYSDSGAARQARGLLRETRRR